MLGAVAWEGRAIVAGVLAGATLTVAALGMGALRVRELFPAGTLRAPWVEACTARTERARAQLLNETPELQRAEVQEAWSLTAAWAEMALAPHYLARIEYRPGDDSPSVFDWEKAPTPVTGSF